MTPSKLKALSVAELMTPVEILSPSDPASKVVGFLTQSNRYEAFISEPERTAIVTIRDLLNIRDIETTKLSNIMYYIPRLNPNNTVGDAATLMFEHRIRSLPIYQAGELKGQITSQSIVKSLLESEIGVKLSTIMTPDPICIDSTDYVSKARRIMIRRKIDQLPVLKDRKLHRVVTSGAIVANILPHVDRTVKG